MTDKLDQLYQYYDGQIADNPETGKQKIFKGGRWHIFDESIQPKYAEGPEGGSVSRFLKGWAKNTIPTKEAAWEMLDALPEPQQTWMASPIVYDPEEGFRISKGVKLVGNVLGGAYEGAIQQGTKAILAGREGNYSEALGHTVAAGLPILGPAAADAAETMATGDIAGGLGEGLGLLLPIARPFKGLGKGPLTRHFRRTAGEHVGRAVGSTAADLPAVLDNAQAISEGIGISGTTGMLTRAKTLSKQSDEALGIVKAKAGSQTKGLHGNTIRAKQIADDLRAKVNPVDIPDDLLQKTKQVPGEPIPSDFVDDVGRPIMKPGKPTTIVDPDSGPLSAQQARAMHSADPATLAATDKLANYFDTVDELLYKDIPFDQAFKMRTQMGLAAKRGAAWDRGRLPGVTVGPGGAVNKTGYGSISQQLKEAVPGLAETDLNSSTWRMVSDHLERAARGEALGPAPALSQLAGRGVGQAAVGVGGGVVGSLIGSPGGVFGIGTGATVGALGAWKVAGDVLNSPLWHTMSARARFNLANQLGTGIMAKSTLASQSVSNTLADQAESPEPVGDRDTAVETPEVLDAIDTLPDDSNDTQSPGTIVDNISETVSSRADKIASMLAAQYEAEKKRYGI
jgi:hypothetical protein